MDLEEEKAVDIDYLTFKVNEKLKEQGKTLELDENDNIKGWDEVVSGLKTQFPTQFDATKGGRYNILYYGRPADGDSSDPVVYLYPQAQKGGSCFFLIPPQQENPKNKIKKRKEKVKNYGNHIRRNESWYDRQSKSAGC